MERHVVPAAATGSAAAATPISPSAPVAAPRRPGMVLDEHRLVRSVNGLAIPIIAENLFQTMLGVVDLLMVSTLGAAAIAGVGSSLQLMFLVISALSAVTVGTTVLVARFTGAGEPAEASRTAKQSLVLGVALAAAITVLGHYYARDVVRMLGVADDVVQTGGDYLTVSAQMSIFLVIQLVCGGALRGAGDARTPMVVTGLVNVVNVIVAYVLIFGQLGFPAMGVMGSAWGAAVARMVGAIVMLAVLASGRRRVDIRGRSGWGPDVALMKRVVRIGLPSMLEQTFMSGGMLLYSMIVIGMGTSVYAAQRITFNALSISFMPGMGFGMAATTMTGQALGAQRPDLADRATWIAFKMAALWMCTMGIALIVFNQQIMRAFSDDPTIIAVGGPALMVIALSQPLQALAQVMSGSLRGAGDTRFPMVATGISVWLVRLPLGWLFGVPLGWGLAGVYISNVIDSAVRAAANYLRYRSGRWRTSRV